MVVGLVFWCHNWLYHVFVVVAPCNYLHCLKFEWFETVVSCLNHCCGRHSWKAVFVKKVCCHFSDTGFSWEHSSPECVRTKGTHVVSWVVGRKSLLVNWFEHCKSLFVDSSQNVGSAGAVVSEFGLKAFSEAIKNIINYSRKLLGALHGSKHFDAGRGSILIIQVTIAKSIPTRRLTWLFCILIVSKGLATTLNIHLIKFAEFCQIRRESENHYFCCEIQIRLNWIYSKN